MTKYDEQGQILGRATIAFTDADVSYMRYLMCAGCGCPVGAVNVEMYEEFAKREYRCPECLCRETTP